MTTTFEDTQSTSINTFANDISTAFGVIAMRMADVAGDIFVCGASSCQINEEDRNRQREAERFVGGDNLEDFEVLSDLSLDTMWGIHEQIRALNDENTGNDNDDTDIVQGRETFEFFRRTKITVMQRENENVEEEEQRQEVETPKRERYNNNDEAYASFETMRNTERDHNVQDDDETPVDFAALIASVKRRASSMSLKKENRNSCSSSSRHHHSARYQSH